MKICKTVLNSCDLFLFKFIMINYLFHLKLKMQLIRELICINIKIKFNLKFH